MNSPLLELSDKQFWHRFMAVYETHLAALTNVRRALEFGVLKGNSIRWLAQKYPNARIYGCDILPLQPEWPLSEAIQYFQLDQASPDQLRKLFEHIGADLDLIIEDGSVGIDDRNLAVPHCHGEPGLSRCKRAFVDDWRCYFRWQLNRPLCRSKSRQSGNCGLR